MRILRRSIGRRRAAWTQRSPLLSKCSSDAATYAAYPRRWTLCLNALSFRSLPVRTEPRPSIESTPAESIDQLRWRAVDAVSRSSASIRVRTGSLVALSSNHPAKSLLICCVVRFSRSTTVLRVVFNRFKRNRKCGTEPAPKKAFDIFKNTFANGDQCHESRHQNLKHSMKISRRVEKTKANGEIFVLVRGAIKGSSLVCV